MKTSGSNSAPTLAPLTFPLSPSHRLSPSSEARLRLLYKRSVQNSTDPFKRAVYCLVGRCEVADSHTDVCTKTEDYMWLKVCVYTLVLPAWCVSELLATFS